MTPREIIEELVALESLRLRMGRARGIEFDQLVDEYDERNQRNVTAARAFLAEPEEQPVAWIRQEHIDGKWIDGDYGMVNVRQTDLYTVPLSLPSWWR
jgi:hypothetical protein